MTALRIDGVDVSHYQNGIFSHCDWNAAKPHVRFAYLKATEGTSYRDANYPLFRAWLNGHGVPVGGYHFAHPTPGSAKAQADYFLNYAKPKKGDLAPALDLEVNEHGMSEKALTTWVGTFFAEVHKYIGEAKGTTYTHFNLSNHFDTMLWVPRYSNPNYAPVIPRPWKTYSIWQFSDGVYGNPSRVPGFHAGCDLNHLNAGVDIRDMQIGVHKPTPAPAPRPAPAPAPKPVHNHVTEGNALVDQALAAYAKAEPERQVVHDQAAIIKKAREVMPPS